jgi:dihydroorotase
MKTLIRKALIIDKASQHNNKIKDILIEEGNITLINDNIDSKADTIIEQKGLTISQGWVDCFANFCDPGYEFKETLHTGACAAAAGGFTTVFVLPNTQPSIQSKSQIEYIVQKATSLDASVLPLGAITKNIEGKELAEMYDMYASGAIAFSDGTKPVQSPGVLLKALQYVKALNGTIIQLPVDSSIASHGLMNESITSTQLGLAGIPSIAEESIIKRDIDLLRYTQSKLHITGISTANSVKLIADAKAEGLQLTSSITPYHLFFCDEDLKEYDTNLKVSPPLHSRNDMLALREAVLNGAIDCIASHHLPQDNDHKMCEFENANNGMIGLQTSFATVNHILPQLSPERLVELFSSNARTIFNLQQHSIEVGSIASITLFNREEDSVLTNQNNKSRSHNSPFFDIALKGKVIGTIHNNKLFRN